jgi:hypothetical protein
LHSGNTRGPSSGCSPFSIGSKDKGGKKDELSDLVCIISSHAYTQEESTFLLKGLPPAAVWALEMDLLFSAAAGAALDMVPEPAAPQPQSLMN